MSHLPSLPMDSPIVVLMKKSHEQKNALEQQFHKVFNLLEWNEPVLLRTRFYLSISKSSLGNIYKFFKPKK